MSKIIIDDCPKYVQENIVHWKSISVFHHTVGVGVGQICMGLDGIETESVSDGVWKSSGNELVADSFTTAGWSSRCQRFMLLYVVLVLHNWCAYEGI